VVKIAYKGQEVEGEDINFKLLREDWNRYQLEDGTELRMRLILSEVVKIPDEYDQEGNPVYVVKSGNITVVKSPDHLKGKPKS